RDGAGLGSLGVAERRGLREGTLPRYFGCPPASPDRDHPPRRRSPPSSCPAGSVVVPGQSRPYSSCASAVFAAMLSAAGAGSRSEERRGGQEGGYGSAQGLCNKRPGGRRRGPCVSRERGMWDVALITF